MNLIMSIAVRRLKIRFNVELKSLNQQNLFGAALILWHNIDSENGKTISIFYSLKWIECTRTSEARPNKEEKNSDTKRCQWNYQTIKDHAALGPSRSRENNILACTCGKIDRNLRQTGKITYCGHEFSEFVPQKTCAYISQHDIHHGEMTVRETLDFSTRYLGVGTRYEGLDEISRCEKEAGIHPDSEIGAFMKAISVSGQRTNLITNYVLKILGLDVCSDIMVGDDMRRGISGWQKKHVTCMVLGRENASI